MTEIAIKTDKDRYDPTTALVWNEDELEYQPVPGDL